MRIYKHIVTNEFYINVVQNQELVIIDVSSLEKAFNAGLIGLGNIIGTKNLVVDNNKLLNVGEIAENQEELTLPFFADKTKEGLLIELFESALVSFESKIEVKEQLKLFYPNYNENPVTLDEPSLHGISFCLSEGNYLCLLIDSRGQSIVCNIT